MTGVGEPGNDLLDRAMASGPPAILYQPLVDLIAPGMPVIGFESLARWPALQDATTADLFAVAGHSLRVAELDWACRTAAVRSAFAAGIDASTAVFVNAEPIAVSTDPPAGDLALWRQAAQELTMVLELTERELLRDVPGLLRATESARAAGWWIALDDVGANPDSLALLEFIRPDMVKLDLTFVQDEIGPDAARTLRGVNAYCERTGARLIAEGIETELHLERALAIGATLGQGYHFGRPGPLRPATAPFRARRVPTIEPADTPFRLLSERRGYRIARRDVLRRFALDIERQASALEDPPVALVTVRTDAAAGPAAVQRYLRLAGHSPLVVLLGAGMPRRPAAGALGADIAPGDPMRDEWASVLVGPNIAIALAAQDLGDTDCADGDRRFRYVLTQDRDLVVSVALGMLNRLVLAEVSSD